MGRGTSWSSPRSYSSARRGGELRPRSRSQIDDLEVKSGLIRGSRWLNSRIVDGFKFQPMTMCHVEFECALRHTGTYLTLRIFKMSTASLETETFEMILKLSTTELTLNLC